MAELMRVAALTGYLATMRELGIDPRALLREVGLSQDHLSNPEHLISAVAAIRLLERSAQLSGCITLGLRMAEVRSGTTGRQIPSVSPTIRQHRPSSRSSCACSAAGQSLTANSTASLLTQETWIAPTRRPTPRLQGMPGS